ncbi:AAA family ATPase [bacterium]|nr:AAA family ATPase [bacterium]
MLRCSFDPARLVRPWRRRRTAMTSDPVPKTPTGIDGLDEILHGGLPRQRACLVRGAAGTGKTTLGLQFLREGLRRGERCLYLTLLQSHDELDDVVASHGWDLESLDVAHVPQDAWADGDGQTLFSAYEIELTEVASVMQTLLTRHRPQRLVIDSVGEIALLVENEQQLHRSLMRLKLQVSELDCTTLVTATGGSRLAGDGLSTIFNGVIELTRDTVLYGRTRRRLEVVKQRGMAFLEGRHDLRIETGGVVVYPRLEYGARRDEPHHGTIATGIAELDDLTGGGLECGSACLLTGGTGVGKSTLASLYACSAADGGQAAAIYCFDERRQTVLHRADGLGLNLRDHVEAGRIALRELAVGEISSGEFVHAVRRAVEEDDVAVVVLDSVTGYLKAMDDSREVILQLHELLAYLGASGVVTILLVTEKGPPWGSSEIDASYMADTVILMRPFEATGAMRRCIAVTKKRHGHHENTLRELKLEPGRIVVGPELTEFSGVLSGTPTYLGRRELISGRTDDGSDDDG